MKYKPGQRLRFVIARFPHAYCYIGTEVIISYVVRDEWVKQLQAEYLIEHTVDNTEGLVMGWQLAPLGPPDGDESVREEEEELVTVR